MSFSVKSAPTLPWYVPYAFGKEESKAKASSIKVLSPNGGETWESGTPEEIIWEASSQIKNVKIEISYYDAGDTHTIVMTVDPNKNDATPNNGIYICDSIPVCGKFCRIIISDAKNPNVYDKSDASFTILPRLIHLDAPDGGEIWKVGSNREITWSASTGIQDVKILLLSQIGQGIWTETPIVNLTPNDGRYTWTSIPPEVVGSKKMIRIMDADNPGIYDDSDGTFAIISEGHSEKITLLAPNEGELWVKEGTYDILWYASSTIESVKIELSTDAGATYTYTIAESLPNDGTYSWIISGIPPEAIGNKNIVRLSDANHPDIYDECNQNFTITESGEPQISLRIPKEGDSWQIGTGQSIDWQWTSDLIPEVDISIIIEVEGGDPYSRNIEKNLVNTGHYDMESTALYWLMTREPITGRVDLDNVFDLWKIPALKDHLEARVKVVSSSNPAISSERSITIPINLGILWDMIADSDFPDSDGDYLPDDIEALLGTDPMDRDQDRDGIYDFSEIFGESGIFSDYALIPNNDHDALIAPKDADDDSDGVTDGDLVDSDNDGIPNYLEYYGYTYNWMSGQFMLWDEGDVKSDPSVSYFKTDPLQPSTDQDPYSDSMEVSGAYMDVSVEDPGNLPMVPAYPDIVIRLEGYAITLNEDITTSSGKSLSKGRTWNAETEITHSHTDETNWEMGTEITATVKASLTDFGGEVSTSFHANYGGSESETFTRGVTKSQGGSVLAEEEWSTARSLNPTDAARIKLFLKVYNYGTATASNIIPSFTLRIGNRNVATFEQGNAQINLLEPGGVYPELPDVYWVIDSVDTGAGILPISLTMDELRALESGAPVSIYMTQMLADVLTLHKDGYWENVGDWRAYMARFESVCSKLSIDVGNGNLINYLVYSGNAPSAPKVTFRDALIWVAGGTEEAGEQKIRYYDRINGGMAEKGLEDWSVLVDPETWHDNEGIWDRDGDGVIDDEFNLLDLVLGPDTFITAKLPHDPTVSGQPRIHYAYFDEVHSLVCAYVSDYYGVKSVTLYLGDPDDPGTTSVEMVEDYTGTGYYSVTLSPSYLWKGTEVIRAANVRAYDTDPPDQAYMSERVVFRLYAGLIEAPEEPLIRWVKLDHNELVLTTEVEARGDSPVETVYLDLLESDEARIYLERLGDREHVWTCSLPDGYHTHDYRELVVAINDRGFAASSAVTERVNVYGAGDVNIYFQRHEYYNHTWRSPVVTGFYVKSMVGSTVNPDWYPEADFGPYAPYEHPYSAYDDGFWHPSYSLDWVKVNWSPATDYATPTVGLKISNTVWHGLTLSDLALMQPVMYPNLTTYDAKVGDAIVSYIKPYFLKAIITGISHTYTEEKLGWWGDRYDHYDFNHTVTVSIRYVIFAEN
ncbi:MAG: binary toxin-like calcium binding domain-containing protein [bacterium]